MLMDRLFDNPKEVKDHSAGPGIHRLYKFDNNYGASLVRFKTPDSSFYASSYSSYTDNENEWELAIIKWDGEDFELVYDTGISDDVIGHLEEDAVEEILQQIRELP